MKTNHQSSNYRMMAKIFAAAWLAMGISQPVLATPTDISDVPMAVLNSVKPNVMFTLDDSGSMQFEVIPENDDVYLTFPRPRTLYGSTYYGSNWSDASYARHARFTLANRYARCYRNAQCNPMYYNPATRYQPWSNGDGSLMPAASPTAAPFNPYNVAEGTRNLTTDQTDERRWTNDDGSSTYGSVTYYPATYFRYIGGGTAPTAVGAANNTAANFERVEIKTGNTYRRPPSAPIARERPAATRRRSRISQTGSAITGRVSWRLAPGLVWPFPGNRANRCARALRRSTRGRLQLTARPIHQPSSAASGCSAAPTEHSSSPSCTVM